MSRMLSDEKIVRNQQNIEGQNLNNSQRRNMFDSMYYRVAAKHDVEPYSKAIAGHTAIATAVHTAKAIAGHTAIATADHTAIADAGCTAIAIGGHTAIATGNRYSKFKVSRPKTNMKNNTLFPPDKNIPERNRNQKLESLPYLSDLEMLQLVDMINPRHMEYFGIYLQIEDIETTFITCNRDPKRTMFQFLSEFRNKYGRKTREKLRPILNEIVIKEGWFSSESIEFIRMPEKKALQTINPASKISQKEFYGITKLFEPSQYQQFVVQHLGITKKEYSCIENECKELMLNPLLDCFQKFQHKHGHTTRNQLIAILDEVARSQGWFSTKDFEILKANAEVGAGADVEINVEHKTSAIERSKMVEEWNCIKQTNHDESPEDLKLEVFDIFLLYCKEDEQDALKFKYYLETLETVKGVKPRVCVYNQIPGTDRFNKLERALIASLYTFVFLSKNLDNDKWVKYYQKEVLAESIDRQRDFVVPILTDKNCTIPLHLKPLQELDISRILPHLRPHPQYSDQKSSNNHDYTGRSFRIIKDQIEAALKAKPCFPVSISMGSYK